MNRKRGEENLMKKIEEEREQRLSYEKEQREEKQKEERREKEKEIVYVGRSWNDAIWRHVGCQKVKRLRSNRVDRNMNVGEAGRKSRECVKRLQNKDSKSMERKEKKTNERRNATSR